MNDALHLHLPTTSIGDNNGGVMTPVAFDDFDGGHFDDAGGPAVAPRVRVARTLGEGRTQHSGNIPDPVQCQVDSERVNAANWGCPATSVAHALVAGHAIVDEAVVGGGAHDVANWQRRWEGHGWRRRRWRQWR